MAESQPFPTPSMSARAEPTLKPKLLKVTGALSIAPTSARPPPPLDRAAALALCLLGLAGCRQSPPLVVDLTLGTVTASLDTKAGARSMAGVLHGLDPTVAAPSELLAPLRIPLYRTGAVGGDASFVKRYYQHLAYQHLASLPPDRRPQRLSLILAEGWGWPLARGGWDRAPYRDLAAWRSYVAAATRAAIDLEAATPGGPVIMLEPWNEPNVPTFWKEDDGKGASPGHSQGLPETFAAAIEEIRAIDPARKVVGPSLSGFDEALLLELAGDLVSRRLAFDAVSWHDYRAFGDLAGLAGDAFALRARLPAGTELHVNESIAPNLTFSPGTVLATLRQLEVGGVDFAAKSGWQYDWGNTLGGLLDGKGGRRALWFAMEAYGAGVAGRVVADSGDIHVPVFASTVGEASDAQVLVLLGNANRAPTGPCGRRSRSCSRL